MNNQNNKAVYGIGGIVIGVIITILLSSTMQSGFMMSGKNSQTGNGNQMMGSIDKHFIEQMIPHHDGAVAMAKLALVKSKRPEIKTLANAIIADQTREIQDMRSWYKDWFGKDVSIGSTAMMGGGMVSGGGMHTGGVEDMKDLESATEFDKVFIEQMIPHHQMAIIMAQMLKSGTSRPEMLQLAKNIESSQAEEIQQMQGWYTQWYK